MSGPITRPIRDDRPLHQRTPSQPRDYAESDQQDEAFEPSAKQAGKLRRALLAIVPSPFRPLASILSFCFWCLAVSFLYAAGAIEWHWVSIPVVSAHTASAEDVIEIRSRTEMLERDLRASIRIQQRARMMSLQDLLCRQRSQSLRAELDELMQDYRDRNGVPYSLPPCEDSKP